MGLLRIRLQYIVMLGLGFSWWCRWWFKPYWLCRC